MTPTRLRGAPRYCPTGCGRAVRAGQLLCAYDWRRVPTAEQRAVNAAWRTWTKTMTDEAWDTYRQARAAALTSVGVTP